MAFARARRSQVTHRATIECRLLGEFLCAGECHVLSSSARRDKPLRWRWDPVMQSAWGA